MSYPGADVWRHCVQAGLIEERLKAYIHHSIKAVCSGHNEASTCLGSDIAAVRKAMDAARHPALLLVDTIFGWRLQTTDTTHGAWTCPSAAPKKAC